VTPAEITSWHPSTPPDRTRRRIHVDLLKVQHHGSNHSTTQDFFERVTADHYVISGNGKHGIPSRRTR
jgi:beta-lactamase superfamily II metal-dependent hydrolase